jgi:hypothetical protein
MIKKNYSTVIDISFVYLITFVVVTAFAAISTIDTLLYLQLTQIIALIALYIFPVGAITVHYFLNNLVKKNTLAIEKKSFYTNMPFLFLASFSTLQLILSAKNYLINNMEVAPQKVMYSLPYIILWFVLFIPFINFICAFKSKKLFYIFLPFSIFLTIYLISIFTPFQDITRKVTISTYNALTSIQSHITR